MSKGDTPKADLKLGSSSLAETALCDLIRFGLSGFFWREWDLKFGVWALRVLGVEYGLKVRRRALENPRCQGLGVEVQLFGRYHPLPSETH